MNYDWRVQVRVSGERNGWCSCLVDTPWFELHSNAQFGGIWSQDGAAKTARDMFARLVQPGDLIAIIVTDLAGDEPKFYQFTLNQDGVWNE